MFRTGGAASPEKMPYAMPLFLARRNDSWRRAAYLQGGFGFIFKVYGVGFLPPESSSQNLPPLLPRSQNAQKSWGLRVQGLGFGV